VILTEADKAQAKELGLTQEELRFAKAAHVAPERYAFHKAAIQAGRDAETHSWKSSPRPSPRA